MDSLITHILPFTTIFHEIAALLLLTAVIGTLATTLRQPLIVAFMAVGILSGPSGFNWLHSAEQVELLAKIGITLLLFVVGLKLDLHPIPTMGRMALTTALGQVLFTSIVGYGLSIWFEVEPMAALYGTVALTFSSTRCRLSPDRKRVFPNSRNWVRSNANSFPTGSPVERLYVSPDLLMMKWDRCRFMGTTDIQIAWDAVPATVHPEVVVVGGAEIMEL